MAHYDAPKMKKGSEDILNELKNFTAAKKEVDAIVTRLRTHWEDENNTRYASKYNNEAKVAAENVEDLMKTFASVLDQAGEAFTNLYNKTGNGIR